MLPPAVHRDEERDERGQRVPALLRRHGRMRREALVDHTLHADAEKPLAHAPLAAGTRMREECRDAIPEHALVQKIDLPAALLFGGRTDELDPDLEILRLRGRGQKRTDDGHRDEVVAAAVPDVGSASYSASSATAGPAGPIRARNAVGR